jgi:ketosteroid isomerase-like protein
MDHHTPSEHIAKLMYTYAERIDAGDFAGVADVFADAILTFEGFGDGVSGRKAVQSLYERTTRRYENGTPRTKHVITNIIVDVGDDGASATSRSSFTVLQAVPGALALQPIIAGRYHDAFAYVEGRWRFTSVHIIIDLVGDLGHHMLLDVIP